jgi:hypothetical protein
LVTKGTYEEYIFKVGSKKLGLDKVILNTNNSSSGKKSEALDSVEINNLLKYGAYHLFEQKDEEKNSLVDEDIEFILDKRTVVVDHSVETPKEIDERTPSLFSKATFAIEGDFEIFNFFFCIKFFFFLQNKKRYKHDWFE